MTDYSDHPRRPLTELEVVVGNILGKTGILNRRQRDLSASMKEQYNSLASSIVRWILHEEDEISDEALERSIACLQVSLERRRSREVKGLRGNEGIVSFKHVAAAVCLRELDRVPGLN